MTATLNEVQSALTVLAAHRRGKPGAENLATTEMAALWHPNLRGLSGTTVIDAAFSCPTIFLPSLPEFVDHCRAVEAARRADDRAEHAAIAPGDDYAKLSKEQQHNRIAALRAIRQYCAENPDRTEQDVLDFARVYAAETDIGVGA